MSNIAEKLAKIIGVIFLAVFLSSCDGGCVSEDEFGGEFVTVKSNPGNDKITGSYDDSVVCDVNGENCEVTGGQRVDWTDTGLRSSGEYFLIQITGEWTPWYGSTTTADSINRLDPCNFCTKKPGFDTNLYNCICHQDQTSVPEISADGFNPVAGVDCSAGAGDEQDPNKCTCTTQLDSTPVSATDYTNYHIPLNFEDKFGNRKSPNAQSVCKYNGGMGLYIGLFGNSGHDVPQRVYHLFTQDRVCDIDLDSDGNCIDENGKDVSKYVFRSPNNAIFVKDDNHGNNSDDDYYGAGATMHSANEVVKLMIYDSYYLDNNGSYNVVFYNGVGNAGNGKGLLEFIVSLVEDAVLGDIDSTSCTVDLDTGTKHCDRTGGIIEFMYKSLVTDSGFATLVQILLSLYISFYGLSVLMGVANITQKELTTRLLKIGMLIFFTSPSSWYFYDEIVVNFFKNSMDYAVGLVMDASDSNLYSPDPTKTSSLILAQMDRAVDVSSATRFAYIDTVIDKLLSMAVAKKVFGLFFATFFGILYIPIIYFLIAFFIYVMLLAASFYLVNVMKIIFVLALGPIFMCFSLFGQTNGIFKKWIAFLGSRSLEVLFLFLILYNFILIIDQKFTDLLYYSSCVKTWNEIPPFKFSILKANIDRSLVAWLTDFVALGGLIFITKMIIGQVPQIAGYLISIGEEGNKDADGVGRGGSSMTLARSMMGSSGLLGAAMDGLKIGASAAYFSAGASIQAGTSAYRAVKSSVARSSIGRAIANSAIGQAASTLNKVNPYRLRDNYRNYLIDSEIKKYAKHAQDEGKTGKDAEMFIRRNVFNSLQQKMHREWGNDTGKGQKTYNPTGMKLADINMTSIARRLDQKLIDEPLKAYIRNEAQSMKNSANPLLGNQMREALAKNAQEWASKNLTASSQAIASKLDKDLNKFIKEQSTYTADEAAKAFRGKENIFLDHLRDIEYKKSQKRQSAQARGDLSATMYQAGDFVSRNISRNDQSDPHRMQQIFLDKVNKQERKDKNKESINSAWDYFSKNANPVNIRDKITGNFVASQIPFMKPSNEVQQKIRQEEFSSLRRSLSRDSNPLKLEKENLIDNHAKEMRVIAQDRRNLENKKASFIKKYDEDLRKLSKEKAEFENQYAKKLAVIKQEAKMITVGSTQWMALNSKEMLLEKEKVDKEKSFQSKQINIQRDRATALNNVNKTLSALPSEEKLLKEHQEALRKIDEKLKHSHSDIHNKRDFYKDRLKTMVHEDVQEKLREFGRTAVLRQEMIDKAKEEVQRIKNKQEEDAKKQAEELVKIEERAKKYEELQKEVQANKNNNIHDAAAKRKEEELKAKEKEYQEYEAFKKKEMADRELRKEGIYVVKLQDEVEENGDKKIVEREMTMLEAKERLRYLEGLSKDEDYKEEQEVKKTRSGIAVEEEMDNPLMQYLDPSEKRDLLRNLDGDNADETRNELLSDTIDPVDSELSDAQRQSREKQESLAKIAQDSMIAANKAKMEEEALQQANDDMNNEKESLQQTILAAQKELEELNKKEVQAATEAEMDVIFGKAQIQKNIATTQDNMAILQKKVAANEIKKVQVKVLKEAEEKISKSHQALAKLEKEMFEVRQSLMTGINRQEMEQRSKKIEDDIASNNQSLVALQDVRNGALLKYDLVKAQQNLETVQAKKLDIDAFELSDENLRSLQQATQKEKAAQELYDSLKKMDQAYEQINQIKSMELLAGTQGSISEEEVQKRQEIAILQKEITQQKAAFASISLRQDLEEKSHQMQKSLQESQNKRQALEKELQDMAERELLIRGNTDNQVPEKQHEMNEIAAKKQAMATQITALQEAEKTQQALYEMHQTRLQYEEKKENYDQFLEKTQLLQNSDEYHKQYDELQKEIGEAFELAQAAQNKFNGMQLISSIETRAQVKEAQDALDEGDIEKAKEMATSIDNRLNEIDDVLDKNSNADSVAKNMDIVGKSSDSSFAKGNYTIQKTQKLSRARLAELDLKVRQAELAQLQSKNPQDLTAAEKVRISVLEQEVAKFEKDVQKFEQEAGDIDNLLKDLEQG